MLSSIIYIYIYMTYNTAVEALYYAAPTYIYIYIIVRLRLIRSLFVHTVKYTYLLIVEFNANVVWEIIKFD